MTSSDCRFFDPLTFWNTLVRSVKVSKIEFDVVEDDVVVKDDEENEMN